jgi:hypothetical protein
MQCSPCQRTPPRRVKQLGRRSRARKRCRMASDVKLDDCVIFGSSAAIFTVTTVLIDIFHRSCAKLRLHEDWRVLWWSQVWEGIEIHWTNLRLAKKTTEPQLLSCTYPQFKTFKTTALHLKYQSTCRPLPWCVTVTLQTIQNYLLAESSNILGPSGSDRVRRSSSR